AGNLARRAQTAQLAVVQHRQTRRVVTAVFEGMQPGQQDGDDVTLGATGNDSTHGSAPDAVSKNVKIQGFGLKRAAFPCRRTGRGTLRAGLFSIRQKLNYVTFVV